MRRHIAKGVVASGFFLSIYLGVIALSSPVVGPDVALEIAIFRNGWLMAALSVFVGVQFFLYSYNHALACSVSKPGSIGLSGTIVSAFASFFPLGAFGCCGTLLVYVSLIFGAGFTTVVFQFSEIITALGMVAMLGAIVLTLRTTLRLRRGVEKHRWLP